MTKIAVRLSSGLLLLVLSCPVAWSQATAEISGSVSDQTGALIPGAELTVTQTDTGITRTVVTNEAGAIFLPNLAIGPYRLEASLPGFQTYVQTGIVLQVGDRLDIDVILQVGQVAQTVEVQANAALVETRSMGVGQLLENERILELPLDGRNVTDLITLAGGSVVTGAARFNTGGSGQPLVSVGGGLGFGTAYTLDGAAHVNYMNAAAMPTPFPDAVQEFKVETAGLSASQGKGSAVNMVTKSGTNEFHGNAFWFVRNDLFNAREYYAREGSTLKRNQYGGTVGGPIVPNQLFFFAGYQGTTLRQDAASSRAFVPTAAMLNGDFSAFQACSGARAINRGGFRNSMIDPALFSPHALEIVDRIGLTPTGPCGEVSFNTRSIFDQHQFLGKVDYQLSDRHSLFGRFLVDLDDRPDGASANSGQSILAHNGSGADNLLHSYAIGSTYLMGDSMVHSFRASINRVNSNVVAGASFNQCDIGIDMFCQNANSYWQVTGAFRLGNRHPDPTFWKAISFGLSDDLSLIRGDHQMNFGVQATQGRQYEKAWFFGVGWMQFRGFATGSPMADFLTGQVSLFFDAGTIEQTPKQTTLALHATDSWSVTPNFTLNYGLRWEPHLPQVMTNGRIYSFDIDRFNQGVKSTVFPNAPTGMSYPGDPGFIGLTGAEKKWWRFAPRAGFAWDVNGDGRTSLRASYSLSYETLAGLWKEDYVAAAPWTNLTVIPSVPMAAPWSTTPGGDPFPLSTGTDAGFNPHGLYQVHPTDVDMPRISSWNLSLQRQFATDWMVSASYLGSRTSKIWAQNPINPSVFIPGNADASGTCFDPSGAAYPFTVVLGRAEVPGPGPCSTTGNTDDRRRFSLARPQDGQIMGAVGQITTDASMHYNGLLVSLQRRVGNLVLNANYTWSHCIGDLADTNGSGPAADETLTNPFDVGFDRGNCDSDRRHGLNWTTVATTPEFANPTLRLVASDWRLSGIYRLSAGSPLNILSGQDNALVATESQRAQQISDSPFGEQSGRPGTSYLDRNAFEVPASGTFGNVGRNSLRGLKTWAFDLSLSRAFQLGESQQIEFRAEGYNITNSFRPLNPDTDVSSGVFGLIRESDSPRIWQFALKYNF